MATTENRNAQETERLIREVLDYDCRRRDLDCNERAMADALAKPPYSGQPIDINTVLTVYEKIKDQLAISPVWEEAVSDLRAAHPEWQYSQALFGILADHWTHPELKACEISGSALIHLAEELDKKQPFPRTDRAIAEQSEINLRARLIHEISLGRSDFYEARDGGNSYIQKFRVDELATLSTERLREVHTLVTDQRRLEKMDSKVWLAEQKRDGIRRDLERLGIKQLPAQWKLTQDGDKSRTGIDMKAGMLVPPTGENIRRMARADIFALTKFAGADAVNQALRNSQK
jgi:hypothetical protein